MRAAKFDVDPALLGELLHLPTNATIFAAHSRILPGGRLVVTIIATDPALPDADQPHQASPSWTNQEVVFSGWGIAE